MKTKIIYFTFAMHGHRQIKVGKKVKHFMNTNKIENFWYNRQTD